MSEKKSGQQDAANAHMLPKQDQAGPPPMYSGPCPTQMAPPPCYPGPPGVIYQPQPGMYGQPNMYAQYPGGVAMVGGQTAPPDHFMMALMVTLFCFCPTGFIALMRASDARSAMARGDVQSATFSSQEAKKFINISIGVGIVSVILTIILMGLYFGMIFSYYRH